jgi:hypothetical protein
MNLELTTANLTRHSQSLQPEELTVFHLSIPMDDIQRADNVTIRHEGSTRTLKQRKPA